MGSPRLLCPMLMLLALSACGVVPDPDFPRETQIDLDRYMGTWYVIANIPPSRTDNAYNSIERYTRGEGNRINVTFTYREGGFDGERNTMHPAGRVIDGTGDAVWAMHFYWLLRLQFVISYVSPDYDTTIVAREKRDFVWIMARSPGISEARYQALVQRVADLGYDTQKLRRVPQQPLSERDDL